MKRAFDLAVAVALACGCSTQAESTGAGLTLMCGGIAGLTCPQGQVCISDPTCLGGPVGCSGTCVAACDPAAREVPPCRIGGCSGELCSDQVLVSACIWRPEFACYRTATCEPQASGECGWTMTRGLAACLACANAGDH